jgi:hypothetical protein
MAGGRNICGCSTLRWQIEDVSNKICALRLPAIYSRVGIDYRPELSRTFVLRALIIRVRRGIHVS